MFGPESRVVVVVGAQWGDEGKGKLVDVLDGFHRHRVGRESDVVRARIHGYLPVVTTVAPIFGMDNPPVATTTAGA